MAGLDPATQNPSKTGSNSWPWMAGSSPAMT